MRPNMLFRLESQVGLPLATEPDSNKYFPVSNSGREVRDKLLSSCLDRGVQLCSGSGCSSLQPIGNTGWDIELANGLHHQTERVVRFLLCPPPPPLSVRDTIRLTCSSL